MNRLSLPHTTLEAVLSIAKRSGADFAEVYAERSERRNLKVINREVKEATSGIELGAGLRLFYGTDVVYAFTNKLDDASLLELASTMGSLKGEAGRVDATGRGGLTFAHSALRADTRQVSALTPNPNATASSGSTRSMQGRVSTRTSSRSRPAIWSGTSRS